MGKKQYFLLVPVSRKAIVAEAQAAGGVTYAVLGGTTTADLNWMGEFPGDAWDQNVVQDETGGRAVVMRISKTERSAYVKDYERVRVAVDGQKGVLAYPKGSDPRGVAETIDLVESVAGPVKVRG